MRSRREVPFVQSNAPFNPPAQENPFYPTNPTKRGNWLSQLQFGALADSLLEVESIENEIAKYLSSDEKIKTEVYQKIDETIGLDASIVDIEVNAGHVKLIGVSLDARTQESLTQAINTVLGVQSVSYQLDV